MKKKIQIGKNINCEKILSHFLEKFINPGFGALPKKEIELIILEVLQDTGYINRNPTPYELVRKLNITKTKARNLIYENSLRKFSHEELDKKIKEVLKNPILQKQGELFVLEIENPLVMDHLKFKLKNLGYATDGSFSQSLVKISLDAMIALIESYLSEREKKEVARILIKAGAPDKSFKGILASFFKQLGKKVAQGSGELFVEEISTYITPILEGNIDKISKVVSKFFLEKEGKKSGKGKENV